jgi:HEAT repeat protein
VPPSEEAVEEIKLLGDGAVPVLAGYLRSGNERERALAVELLGRLGGRRVFAPLREAIRGDTSPALRVLAMRWITQTSWDSASAVIREAAEKDSDENVRREAQSILASHAPE